MLEARQVRGSGPMLSLRNLIRSGACHWRAGGSPLFSVWPLALLKLNTVAFLKSCTAQCLVWFTRHHSIISSLL